MAARRRHRLIIPVMLAMVAGLSLPGSAWGADPPRRASAAALEAARRFLCPHGGTPMPGPRGRGRCRPGSGTGALGEDPSVIGWDAGLPPAARSQAPCPPGTQAVAPLAWSNATRCLPR